MAEPVLYALSTADLAPLPVGALVLLASHRSGWRDRMLFEITLDLVLDDVQVVHIALSERPESAETRFAQLFEQRCVVWAENKATEIHGHYAPDAPSDATSAERSAAERRWRTARANEVKKWQAAYLQEGRDYDHRYVAVSNPTLENIETATSRAASQPRAILIDDLSAIFRSPGKSGAAKLCGEHARALKDLAVAHKLLMVAGMPAPYNLQMVRRNEYRSEKVEREVVLRAGDFAAYGNPDEVCDAMISTYETWGTDGAQLTDYAIRARYGIVPR